MDFFNDDTFDVCLPRRRLLQRADAEAFIGLERPDSGGGNENNGDGFTHRVEDLQGVAGFATDVFCGRQVLDHGGDIVFLKVLRRQINGQRDLLEKVNAHNIRPRTP